MAVIPVWLIGRNVTAMTVTVQTVASNGTLADSTGVDIAAMVTAGVVDEIQLTGSRSTENIADIGDTEAHHVRVSKRDSFTVSEIMRSGNSLCLLANLWFSATSKYVKVVFTRGGNTWTFYGVMVSYSEQIVRGKNVARMSMAPVSIGAFNADFA